MKFGKVDDPETVDFSIPADDAATLRVLGGTPAESFEVFVGCAKWNRTDLKNFYPKGVKDELEYYSSHFNCIELNATFYRLFPAETFEKWYATVPDGFRFYPKLEQSISHFKRLKDVAEAVERNVMNFSLLREKLGMAFLQLHNNFGPKDLERVETFVANWSYDMPLAMEFRHRDWFGEPAVAERLYQLLESKNITNVLVDCAGRRDLMHMRLTTPATFIRYVGANHRSDYSRLDAWVEKIAEWKAAGLQQVNFFVHQNVEKESPLLSAYFIERLNKRIGTQLAIPKTTIPVPFP